MDKLKFVLENLGKGDIIYLKGFDGGFKIHSTRDYLARARTYDRNTKLLIDMEGSGEWLQIGRKKIKIKLIDLIEGYVRNTGIRKKREWIKNYLANLKETKK